jgi:peptide chain release factor 1
MSNINEEIVLELQSGCGGDDSKIFVGELFAVYMKYADSKGFKSEILHTSAGHMIALIKGKDVGKKFADESGKHCVQRIPPTETKSRKQTSMISVAVLPLREKVETELKDSDLEIAFVNIGGPGGQHQNKTASAVRMRHKPTGLKVLINGRDQHSNKREARRILAARVEQKLQKESDSEYNADRKDKLGDGGRSDKIRTYNFLKGRITDHITGKKTGNIKKFMKGNLEVLK